ncbi:hypothetical protein L210DRAFT_3523872 [Boletus edulis BED1]|uniref:Uncharacterized protein n=1 Tax=Boletus edulis BED1 TaxID=1328754 RepID=A0AAD4C4T7_BOLED|nr:hypothetical protein L210DRAFT_3523872 [Boletus edulis BED1]
MACRTTASSFLIPNYPLRQPRRRNASRIRTPRAALSMTRIVLSLRQLPSPLTSRTSLPNGTHQPWATVPFMKRTT